MEDPVGCRRDRIDGRRIRLARCARSRELIVDFRVAIIVEELMDGYPQDAGMDGWMD